MLNKISKKRLIVVVIVLSILSIGFFGRSHITQFIGSQNVKEPAREVEVVGTQPISHNARDADTSTPALEIEVIAENLTIPWDIVFLSGGDLLVSERDGTIVRLNPVTKVVTEIEVPGVSHRGEGGLLGMVAHPDFTSNGYLYLYITSTLGDDPNASVNEVVRYRFSDDTLLERKTIVGNIPGSLYHNGGRIAFGPDGYLYITTGDARVPESAENLTSLAGKILRVTSDGEIPDSNPYGTPVYAYGTRNAQGLTWDSEGNLWSTEHGRTTATQSGMDELNLIVSGGNYGWPLSEGDTVLPGTIAPIIHSGASVTWAPGSALYYDGSVFFGGLRGATLYEAVLEGTKVIELREHFKGVYGRLRTISRGPDGMLYLTTSNRDGRGKVHEGDDKIIRLDPAQFRR